MLAAAKIPALLLIFTAKSHDSRERQTVGGGRLTVKVLGEKKNVCRSKKKEGKKVD